MMSTPTSERQKVFGTNQANIVLPWRAIFSILLNEKPIFLAILCWFFWKCGFDGRNHPTTKLSRNETKHKPKKEVYSCVSNKIWMIVWGKCRHRGVRTIQKIFWSFDFSWVINNFCSCFCLIEKLAYFFFHSRERTGARQKTTGREAIKLCVML